MGDLLPLQGIDHLHYFVGNARQAAHFYRTALGFSLTAYRGPETGVRDCASYLLEQAQIRLILSTPLSPSHPMSGFIHQHGDAVRDIALRVASTRDAWSSATSRGAESVEEPSRYEVDGGIITTASIRAYGDVIHTFIEREGTDALLPGFRPVAQPDPLSRPVGIKAVDHIVGNVGWGEMDRWVEFYEKVMGFSLFQSFDDKDISTEYSALMSKVVSNGSGRIRFPINEPASGRRKSQIEEYLEFHQGPGVQHVALLTGNILETVDRLQAQGIEFLRVPSTYYRELALRVGPIAEPVDELERLGILVDRDDEGYLLQIFTRPVEDRPTLFYEIIQRKGSRSFGKGNFKALFEAIEREQELRGNL